ETVQLPLADTIGAKVRLEARSADGTLVVLSESDPFAVGHSGAIRLDVQRDNESQFAPPVLHWDPVPGAARYEVSVASDPASSCLHMRWPGAGTIRVNAPRTYLGFDRAAWTSMPATRCELSVEAFA